MKEIGGYFELDQYHGTLLHEGAIALNCGRAALEYLIRARGITKVYIPAFCCDAVVSPCKRCGIAYEYYPIQPDFRPAFTGTLGENEWLYIVNFYGQLTNNELAAYQAQYGRVIADQAHAYFQLPVPGMDTLYTCRKFFGVADGAFLYTDCRLDGLERDESFQRIHFVLGRYERDGSTFYSEAANNNDVFDAEPLKTMSRLTENLLRGIDYDAARQRRTRNFAHLHKHLGPHNRLLLTVPEGAYMYPLYLSEGAALRKTLQAQKIYIPTLWPDVFDHCAPQELAYDYTQNILPLPVDQRYDIDDMNRIISALQQTGRI